MPHTQILPESTGGMQGRQIANSSRRIWRFLKFGGVIASAKCAEQPCPDGRNYLGAIGFEKSPSRPVERRFLKPNASKSVFLRRLGSNMFRIIGHPGRCEAYFSKLIAHKFFAAAASLATKRLPPTGNVNYTQKHSAIHLREQAASRRHTGQQVPETVNI